MPTLTRRLTIKNRLGLHARAAALLMQTACRFKAQVQVSKEAQTVDGKSILGLMMLAAGQGAEIEITVAGEDADAAMVALVELIESGFNEEG